VDFLERANNGHRVHLVIFHQKNGLVGYFHFAFPISD
jgi:hypothetical protein